MPCKNFYSLADFSFEKLEITCLASLLATNPQSVRHMRAINLQALVLHYVKEFLYSIIVIIASERMLEVSGLHVTQRPQSSDWRVRTAASVKEND
jgi:hypothetical protein